MPKFKDVFEFQKAFPTKADKEKALKTMSNAEIDVLIKSCPNVQGKVFYSKFKSK